MAKADWIKREAFARAYADCGNASQAARQAGVPEQSAHSMGYKWLRDRRVVEMVRDAMNDRLKALGPLAIGVVRDIMLSDQVSAQTRLHAARDILDRLGWVPPRRVIQEDCVEKSVEEMTQAELEYLVAGQPHTDADGDESYRSAYGHDALLAHDGYRQGAR